MSSSWKNSGDMPEAQHNKEAGQYHGPWVENNMLFGICGRAVKLEVDRRFPWGPVSCSDEGVGTGGTGCRVRPGVA